jgi:DNA mismatch repair protein MutL
VRFEDGVAIWQIVNAAVREALAKTGAVSLMDFDEEGKVEIPVMSKDGPVRVPPISTNPGYNPFAKDNESKADRADISDFVQPYESRLSGMERDEAIGRFDESVLEFIEGPRSEQGRLIEDDYGENAPMFNGALMLSGGLIASARGGRLVIIDLQRAKEAILYQRYMVMLGNDTSVSQRLLFPEVMIFSNDDVQLLREHHDDFAAFGFEYSLLDDNKVEITGIPADFLLEDLQTLIYDMIDGARDEGQRPSDMRRERLAAIMSRDSSRRLSKSYTEGEVAAILESLGSGGHYNYTPAGHPVMTEIGQDQLKKFFTN